MIKLLLKIFVKESMNVGDAKVRETYSVLGGCLGIICNLFLFGLKLALGTVMGSIAIISDAFNNLSDTGSSLVAILGAKLANQKPDREHPFGHGRIEYISSLIVSFVILLVGVELLKSGVAKIKSPQIMEFNMKLILILAASVFIKVWMFSYNNYLGKAINSSVLKATARDSLNDVIATSAVIVTTIVGNVFQWPVLDGIVGIVVALLILYTGMEIAKDTIGMLLGTPPSKEIIERLEGAIVDGVHIVGIHDLIVHDYGPGRIIASVHAEVSDQAEIIKIHEVIDAVEQKVMHEMWIELVIHMDPISIDCDETKKTKQQLLDVIKDVDDTFSIHDFRITKGENRVNLIFDLVVSFSLKDKELDQQVEKIKNKLKQVDEKYCCVIQIDRNYCEV